jgi:hypothetical protein
LGNKILYKSSHLNLEFEDAKTLELNEKFTLMKWGNAIVKSIKE